MCSNKAHSTVELFGIQKQAVDFGLKDQLSSFCIVLNVSH